MESFEQFVAIAMDAEGLVVSGAVKFPVRRRTAKRNHEEYQAQSYEVDLVACRADKLVLASVKSFFGSGGVHAEHVMATGGRESDKARYVFLNDPDIRSKIVEDAAERYGYRIDQVRVRLYVGKFAAPVRKTHEPAIRQWAATQEVGGGPIEVFGLSDLVHAVRSAAASKTYRDNPVLVTMKVLEAAGMLAETDTSGIVI